MQGRRCLLAECLQLPRGFLAHLEDIVVEFSDELRNPFPRHRGGGLQPLPQQLHGPFRLCGQAADGPVSARRVDRLIRDLSDRLKVTSIVVSHDLPSIFGIADRIVMLYKGKVRLLGTPEDFRNSDDPVIAQFINGRAEGPID